MNRSANPYKRHRFPPAIIQYAVWLYHRFNLSQRDIEDLLAERGIEASYESVRPWCIKFDPLFARRGGSWVLVPAANSTSSDESTQPAAPISRNLMFLERFLVDMLKVRSTFATPTKHR